MANKSATNQWTTATQSVGTTEEQLPDQEAVQVIIELDRAATEGPLLFGFTSGTVVHSLAAGNRFHIENISNLNEVYLLVSGASAEDVHYSYTNAAPRRSA